MAVHRAARVTSADVARESGFSRQLVGFVLNNTPNQSIPEVTRAKVLTAAEKLGYVPHGPAQALRRGRGRVVLLAMPNLPQGPTVVDTIATLADELGTHGFTLVTHLAGAEHRSPLDVAAVLAPIAVLGFSPFTATEVTRFTASGAAVVLPGPETLDDPGVDDGGARIGDLQVEHLAARGHRHLVYALPADARLLPIAERRCEGARRAAHRLGLPEVRAEALDGDTEEAVRALRRRSPDVTGVAAYNDEVAFAVLDGARRSGLEVPSDLAVIGADDIAVAVFARPPLTTVAISGGRIGVAVARRVVRLLGTTVPPSADEDDAIRLVVRSST